MTFLDKITYWIFDMDGTLSIPILDFKKIRIELGLPLHLDILTAIDEKPAQEAHVLHKRLREIEKESAHRTKAQPGVKSFLDTLQSRGVTMGIVTRNNREVTMITLETMGLKDYFSDTHILTREFTPAKPHGAPILHFLNMWQALPEEAVIIGDYKHDMESGIAAGVHRIFFDSKRSAEWNHLAELSVRSWNELGNLL